VVVPEFPIFSFSLFFSFLFSSFLFFPFLSFLFFFPMDTTEAPSSRLSQATNDFSLYSLLFFLFKKRSLFHQESFFPFFSLFFSFSGGKKRGHDFSQHRIKGMILVHVQGKE